MGAGSGKRLRNAQEVLFLKKHPPEPSRKEPRVPSSHEESQPSSADRLSRPPEGASAPEKVRSRKDPAVLCGAYESRVVGHGAPPDSSDGYQGEPNSTDEPAEVQPNMPAIAQGPLEEPPAPVSPAWWPARCSSTD